MHKDADDSPCRGLRALGWVVLVLGIPLGLVAALHPANEYQASVGINATDCDGPVGTYLVAAPALLIYGAGLIVNGMRWRRRANALAALACLGMCVAVLANVGSAIAEERRQAQVCS